VLLTNTEEELRIGTVQRSITMNKIEVLRALYNERLLALKELETAKIDPDLNPVFETGVISGIDCAIAVIEAL